MTELATEPERIREACDDARRQGRRVGVVPTMGALHAGHATLVREAAQRADFVVVTIFVNPTQFGPNEDLARYPRTLDADRRLAEQAGARIIFAPSEGAMYPRGDETRVKVGRTAEALCGVLRPGHFEGVTTVVAKLLNLVGPSVACFGRKDYQQYRAIARMVKDLFMPIELVAVPTVREPDGLALSSRNRYLSDTDRARARAVPTALTAVWRAFQSGTRDARALELAARAVLEPTVDSIDYVTVADPETVVPIDGDAGDRALVATAVRVGAARLIDNVVLGEEPPPIASEKT